MWQVGGDENETGFGKSIPARDLFARPAHAEAIARISFCVVDMFAALDQRIATRFTIKPMDLAESAAYLKHHLKLAGRDEPLLADDAIARLHRVSNGLPRALNNAATAALIAAADGKDLIDDACAKKAVAELTRD